MLPNIGKTIVSETKKPRGNAKIKGNVYYNLVELAVGAEVNGKLVHTPAKPDEEVGLELNYNEVSE